MSCDCHVIATIRCNCKLNNSRQLCLLFLITSYICVGIFCVHSRIYQYLLLRPFPYLGSVHQVFILHIPRSCASSIFTYFSFMSFRITSLHFSFCLSVSIHFHLPCSHYVLLLLLPFSPHVIHINRIAFNNNVMLLII